MKLCFCLAFPWPDPGLSLCLNCDRTRNIIRLTEVCELAPNDLFYFRPSSLQRVPV
jgi:hypothetical protein